MMVNHLLGLWTIFWHQIMTSKPIKFSFAKKFVSGEAQFGFWDTVSTFIGFINTFFIISALTVYEYGVFQLALSVYAIFNNVLALGGSVVSNDILRFIGQGREAEAKRLYFEYQIPRFILGLCFSAFILFGTGFLSRWYAPAALAYIKPLAFLLLLEIIFSNFKVILGYRLQFRLNASRATFYKIVQLAILTFFFVRHSLGVKEIIYSMISGSIVSILVLIRPVSRSYRVWRDTRASEKPIIHGIFKNHGKWDIFQQLASKLTSNLQPWIIKTFISTEAVAIYTVALTMATTLVGFFPNKTLGSLVPLQINDNQKMLKIYSASSRYLFLFAVAVGLFGAVTFPIVIYLVFPKYISSLPYFWALLLWLPVSALSSVASTYLVVLQKQKYLFYQKVLKSITVLPLLAFAYFSGLWGLVLYQISFSIILFYSVYLFLRNVDKGYKINVLHFFRFDNEDRAFLKIVQSKIGSKFRNSLQFLTKH